MYFDYLKNQELDALTEQLRLRAQTDAEAFDAEAGEASRSADASLVRFLALMEEYTRRIADTLSKFAAGLRRGASLLQPADSMFKGEVDHTAFPTVCQIVMRAETDVRTLRACLDELTELRRAQFATMGGLQEVLRFLSAARIAVMVERRELYASYVIHATESFEQLEALEKRAEVAQRGLLLLLSEQLPRFFASIHDEADYNHNGAGCKAYAVRRFLDEMAYSVENCKMQFFGGFCDEKIQKK
jgi:hypothetical protein